jgi:hypothetical protein
MTMKAGRGHWLFVLLLFGCVQQPSDPYVGVSPALRNWTDAQGIAGFDNLRWKMKEQEIAQLYPAFRPPTDRTGWSHLEMKDYEMMGCRFAVNLGFFDDELTNLQFNYSGDRAESCATQIKSNLQSSFGPGKVNQEFGLQSAPGGVATKFPILYTIWNGPQLVVFVDETTYPNGSRSLAVDYIHSGAPGTYIE